MKCSYDLENTPAPSSSKSRFVALILGIFLVGIGIHNFYLGKVGKGLLKILMRIIGVIVFSTGYFEKFHFNEIVFYVGLCILFIPRLWAFFECIFIVLGKAEDSDGLTVVYW